MPPFQIGHTRGFRPGFHIGRGRLEGGDVPYADILALSPSVFVQLRYATLDGTQRLFQDAAGTVPVTTAGQDTIGAVRDADGNIVAAQATEAHRPLWMGETIGAQFDGVDDHLDFTRSAYLLEEHTLMAMLKVDSGVSFGERIWGHRGGDTEFSTWYFRDTASFTYETNSGSNQNNNSDSADLSNALSLASVRIEQSGADMVVRTRVDDSVKNQTVASYPVSFGTDTDTLGAYGSGLSPMGGVISSFAKWDRPLTDNEATTAEAALIAEDG